MSYNYDYGEWFADNIIENINKYVNDFYDGAEDYIKKREQNRLTKLYTETYGSDPAFESYCEDRAEYLGEVAYDMAIESQMEAEMWGDNER